MMDFYNFGLTFCFQLKAFASALCRPALFPVPAPIVNLIFGPERAVMLLDGAKIKPENVMKTAFVYKYPKMTDACRELVQKRSD